MNKIKNNAVDFTKLDPKVWENEKQLRALVKEVRVATKIITSQGEYLRTDWKSGYHDVLTWHCQNPKKAEIILEAFNKHFSYMAENSRKEAIREFIKRNHMFIGTKKPKFNFSKSSIAHLADQRFLIHFDQFLTGVSSELKSLYSQNTAGTKVNKKAVAILTCNAGGGHRMVAFSIQKQLESKGYQAKVINVDELPGDSLDVVSAGVVKTWHIFSKFRCQENNHRKADLFCDLRWELHPFIPSRTLFEANCEIQRLGAKLVLNTIHHETQWISPLSESSVPVGFVNTDYELPPQLKRLRNMVDSDHFQVLTPIDYSPSVKGMIPMGYPIRSGFEEKLDESEKLKIREKYGIGANDRLVVVQMGSLAMGLEREIKKFTNLAGLNHKCHFIFLCATNEKAKKFISEAQAKNSNQMVVLTPIGMQNDQELSGLYQTCDAILGKPGGATSAEIATTGSFLLAYDPLPWERANLKYLEERNQAVEIQNISELKDILNRGIHRSNSKTQKVLNWKKNLQREVAVFFDEHHIDKSSETEEIKPYKIKVVKPFPNGRFYTFFIRHGERALGSIKTLFRYLAYLFQVMSTLSFRDSLNRFKVWWKYS